MADCKTATDAALGSTAAARQRRYRERRRRDVVVVPVELGQQHLDVLVERGLLASDADDSAATGCAVTKLLDSLASLSAEKYRNA